MLRSERRRQARDLKKRLEKMSVSEVQEFISDIYVVGVNDTMALNREALKEEYGFGDGRYTRIHEYITERLTKSDRKTLENMEKSDKENDNIE